MLERSPIAAAGLSAALLLAAAAPSAGAAAAEAPAAAEAAAIAVGDEAPGFTLRSAADGTEHSLAAHRGERPVVLVFFRGAW